MRRLKHKYTKHANITSNSDLCTDERLITQRTVLINLDLRTFKGVRKGGWGQPPPWAWYFTKTLLPSQRRL